MGGGESRSASSSSRLCVHIFRALSNRIVGCLRHGTPRSSPIILHKQPTIACRNLCTHGRRGTLLPAVACPVTFFIPWGLGCNSRDTYLGVSPSGTMGLTSWLGVGQSKTYNTEKMRGRERPGRLISNSIPCKLSLNHFCFESTKYQYNSYQQELLCVGHLSFMVQIMPSHPTLAAGCTPWPCKLGGQYWPYRSLPIQFINEGEGREMWARKAHKATQ